MAGAPVTDNVGRLLAFTLATSLGFDIPRAVGNAVLIALLGAPALRALRRAHRVAAFDAPREFVPLGPSGLPAAGSTR